MLLSHAEIDFNNQIIEFAEWPALKPTMPNGQLPVLELANGKKMGQSGAILRYLGMNHGYYPDDPLEAQECDEFMDGYADILAKVYKPHFEPSVDTTELFSTVLPKYLDSIDAACAKGQFLCGANLTVADFAVGCLYTNYFNNAGVFKSQNWKYVLDKFPNFKAYGERFSAANA